jgi:hypothetical protein
LSQLQNHHPIVARLFMTPSIANNAGGLKVHDEECVMSERPNEASAFRFSIGNDAPDRAMLEFDPVSGPVRVLLAQNQLDRLSIEAKVTSVKLSWRSQGCESK